MYEVTFPDTINDAKNTNFGSVVCFLGAFFEPMSRPEMFPFQLYELGVNECHFG